MNILENAKNHFRDKLSGDLQSVEVPEWGTDGTPAKLYFKPAINFQSQEKMTIDGMIGRFKTGEQSGNPLILMLSKLMIWNLN